MVETIPEEMLVQAWRAEEFVRMGFKPTDAFQLAESDADLHQAQQMIDNGCKPKLALRILT